MAAVGGRRWMVLGFGVLMLSLGLHCGPEGAPDPGTGTGAGQRAGEASPPPAEAPETPPEDGGEGEEPEVSQPALGFQTAFANALRASEPVGQVRTFRVRIPSVLEGARVRVTFRAGDQGMRLFRAYVATESDATPVPLLLPETAADMPAEERVRSEAAPLRVRQGEDVLITFEAVGSVATSVIDALPGTEVVNGARADTEGDLGGSVRARSAGVVALEVEAPSGPVMVALGDSITEGYVSGRDDIRKAWPQLAAEHLGLPVVNAGVSAQGVKLASARLDEEVLSLEGITDCVVLLGTNDLHSHTAEQLTQALDAIFDRLRPHCRVWASPLLPKERTSVGALSEVLARREAVNAWLREVAELDGLVELDAAVEGAPGRFVPGLAEDGIHPSVKGHEVLGQAAADTFDALLPDLP